MTIAAAVMVFLTLAGCSAFRPDLPPWARPVPGSAGSPATVSSEGQAVASTSPPDATTREPSTPMTPAPVAAAPVATAPPPIAPTPARPTSPPPPPAPPGPVAPPALVAPPAPVAPPSSTSPSTPQSTPQSPSLPLTASLPPAEVRRLQEEAQRAIDETERLLRQLDGRPLVSKDLETLRLTQGLVEQARKALGGQEYERAANLAAKARTLAEDLSTRR